MRAESCRSSSACDLLQLVRRAEPVEEMEERHARLERRGVRDERQVLRFLHRRRREQREAGRAHRHDVAVVAEDRQRVRGDRARRDVEDRRRQLARDLEHVRDHQQQALAGREGRGQPAALQRAVHGAGGARLRSASRRRMGTAPQRFVRPRPPTRRRSPPCSTKA